MNEEKLIQVVSFCIRRAHAAINDAISNKTLRTMFLKYAKFELEKAEKWIENYRKEKK